MLNDYVNVLMLVEKLELHIVMKIGPLEFG